MISGAGLTVSVPLVEVTTYLANLFVGSARTGAIRQAPIGLVGSAELPNVSRDVVAIFYANNRSGEHRVGIAVNPRRICQPLQTKAGSTT